MSVIRTTVHAALGAALLIGFAQTADAKTYRMSNQWTEKTAGAKVDKWWAAEIEKRTNGAVKIKIFWEGVLGKAKENLGLIQQGAIAVLRRTQLVQVIGECLDVIRVDLGQVGQLLVVVLVV